MGEGRQVMLSSRHTCGERPSEKERRGKRDGTQTHVLRILRRARTQPRCTRRAHDLSTQARRHFNTRHSCCRVPWMVQLATWLGVKPAS